MKTFPSVSVISIICLNGRFIGIPLFFFFFNAGVIVLGIWRRERVTTEQEAAVLKLLQATSWKVREVMKCFRKAFLPLMLDHLYKVNKWEKKKWDIALLKESESPGEVCTNNQAPEWAACNLLWKCTSTPSWVLQSSLWWEVCPLFSSFLCTLISALPSDLLWHNTIFKKNQEFSKTIAIACAASSRLKSQSTTSLPGFQGKGKNE